jgi:hypothetical protein
MKMPPYAWQIRIADYVSLFEKVKPLFEKHLNSSSYSKLTERLNFNFYHCIIQIAIENGAITEILKLDRDENRTMFINPLVFVKLLFGHASREELEMAYPDFIVRPNHRPLIDVLFPKLPSYIHSGY